MPACSASCQASSRVDEGGLHVLAEGLDHLHHQLVAARRAGGAAAAGARFAPGLEPGGAGVAAAARVGAHVGRAAEARDAAQRGGRAVAVEVDLQGRADEQVAGVVARRLAERAVAAQAAVGAGEEHVGARADVVLHAQLGAEGMHRLDPAGLDRRDQRRVRVRAPSACRSCPSGPATRHRSAAAARWPPCRSRCRGSGAARRIRRRCP